jgi:hypothetical protein
MHEQMTEISREITLLKNTGGEKSRWWIANRTWDLDLHDFK